MKITSCIFAVATVALAMGCTRGNDVNEARQDLQESRQEAAQDVNEAKKDAAENVSEAQSDVQEAEAKRAEDQRQAASAGTSSGATSDTVSGTTSNASDQVKVSKELCDRLAKEDPIKPENKAQYDACAREHYINK